MIIDFISKILMIHMRTFILQTFKMVMFKNMDLKKKVFIFQPINYLNIVQQIEKKTNNLVLHCIYNDCIRSNNIM